MKKLLVGIFAAVLLGAVSVSLSSCKKEEEPKQTGITQEQAAALMEDYLRIKGFDGDDFLAECKLMELDGVRVYAFSWRTKVNENADRLFGTYAVSLDGASYYEYQSEREVWIRDSITSQE